MTPPAPAPVRQDGNTSGIAALLRPRSIVIVGASEKSRWSRTTFDNLMQSGFVGRVHLVNRRGDVVHGQQSFETCGAIGEQVDLGVVIVPAEAAVASIDDFGRAGGRAAVVLTSGFAETGAAGMELQNRLHDAAKVHGVRLLGPNSLGFVNFADNVLSFATPIRAPSRRKGTGIVSQSGATAFFLAELAYQQDIGVSYVVATGNEVDVDVSSVAEYLVDDPRTQAIALFIETVRDPASFLRAAKRALQIGKPIVVLKVGASEVTAKSAAAHTGALVGDDRVFDGLCRQFGIIRVRSIEELLATSEIVARTGALRPGGLCFISNSGGICEIAADAAQLRGIELPDVDAPTATALQGTMPGFGTPHNPLDLTGGIEPAQCEEAIRILGGQERYAAILCAWYSIPVSTYEESPRLAQLHHHLSKGLNEADVPGLLVSYTPAVVNDHAKKIIGETKAPYVACGFDRAISAFAGAFWWSKRQREAKQSGAIAQTLQRSSGERPSSERAALEYFERKGVPVVPATVAVDEAQAVAAANGYGGRVVLKIASPDIAHKSDIGGVALNLDGEQAVRSAYRRIVDAARSHAPDARIDGVIVSPMRDRGVELIVGMSRDAQWGPVLAVGLGGVWVEVLQDVSLRILPTHVGEIRNMLTELKGAKMLAGQRGIPAADLDAVAAVIARIADAMLELGPDLVAMDVNPLWVRGDHVEALDALFVWQDETEPTA